MLFDSLFLMQKLIYFSFFDWVRTFLLRKRGKIDFDLNFSFDFCKRIRNVKLSSCSVVLGEKELSK